MVIDRLPQGDERTPRGVTCSAMEAEVIIRGGLRSGTGTVIAICAGAIAIGMLFVFFSPRPEAIPAAAPMFLAATAATLACLVGLQLLSRERLFVDSSALVYERHLAAFCWQRRGIPRSEPIELLMRTKGARRGVVVAAGGERWLVGRALDAEGIEWLHAWLADRLLRTKRNA